jgi:NAD(P)H-hydrate epimerase
MSSLPKLPPRRPDSHKGDFGRALLIGGSRGMAGAIALAGMACLRSGAGLV